LVKELAKKAGTSSNRQKTLSNSEARNKATGGDDSDDSDNTVHDSEEEEDDTTVDQNGLAYAMAKAKKGRQDDHEEYDEDVLSEIHNFCWNSSAKNRVDIWL
jgi:hypothetical protein